MMLGGLGSKWTTPRLTTSKMGLEAALKSLENRKIELLKRSAWFRSAPVPESDQPWFVNGVASLRTDLSTWELLAVLHEVEAEHEGVLSVPTASRTLDLDLLAYVDRVVAGADGMILPHASIAPRALVLQHLADLAPDRDTHVRRVTGTSKRES